MIEKDPEKRRGVSDELVDEFIKILHKPYDKRCIMTDMKEKAEELKTKLLDEYEWFEQKPWEVIYVSEMELQE